MIGCGLHSVPAYGCNACDAVTRARMSVAEAADRRMATLEGLVKELLERVAILERDTSHTQRAR